MRNLGCFILLTCILFNPSKVYTQWSTDPDSNLIVGYGLLPEICSDSAGGCYITYEQGLVYPRKLILERLNRYGIKSWISGKEIAGNLPEQNSAKVIEDGNHGIFISYLDMEAINLKKYAYPVSRLMVQRVDSNGHSFWETNGINVSLSNINQTNQAIVSDGSGGCIIAWKKEGGKLFAQRIDVSGVRIWSDTGIVIDSNTQYTPQIIKIDNENFVIAYGSTLKRINLQGELIWGEGVNVGFGTRSILCDKEKNLIVYDASGVPENILYVTQKFDSLGNKLWQNPFIIIADSTIYSYSGYPINTLNGNEVVFSWQENISSVSRIHAQKLSSVGSNMWGNDGILVSPNSSEQAYPLTINSDSNSIIYLWRDSRGGNYAQRLETFGNIIWDSNDVNVSRPILYDEKITSDCNGGFIFVGSGESFSIRVQQVSKNGRLGDILSAIVDYNSSIVPQTIKLNQNYPNPFNSSTKIQYELPRYTHVRLELLNILGQNVEILLDGFQPAGFHNLNFNAKNISTGLYFYRLITDESILTKKLLIIY